MKEPKDRIPSGWPERKREQRNAAAKREADWKALNPAQQLAALDARLGRGAGACKQRTRLTLRLLRPGR